MKRFLFPTLALVAATLLIPPPTIASPDRHVVIVSIDGLAAFHLYNPALKIPNIRRFMREGAWADHSLTVFPSVTHPSHTTIITGVYPARHGVVGNGVYNRKTGESFHVTNKPHAETVKAPTLMDAMKDAGGTTAAFFWPETYRDAAVDFNIPEIFLEGEVKRGTTPAGLWQELIDAGIPLDRYRVPGTPLSAKLEDDDLLARAAAYVLEKHRPNLLLIHLLATDSFQHRYTADSDASRYAIESADRQVGRLVDASTRAGMAQSTTFFVVADHGFLTTTLEVRPLKAFVATGLATADEHGEATSDAIHFQGGGYVMHVFREGKVDEKTFSAALADVREMEGIHGVYLPRQYPGLGLPTQELSPLVGDAIIVANPDASMSRQVTGPPIRQKDRPGGSHGFLPGHSRMYPAFVAWGADIRKGARPIEVRNVDIAPTAARLLGVTMVGELDGEVIRSILGQQVK